MERAKRLGVPGERPPGAADALPGGVRVDVEHDRVRTRAERRACPLRQHRSSTECDDSGVRVTQHVVRGLLLERPERRLPPLLEELGDRRARARLELAVEVDERPAEAGGRLAPEGRLARAHEPGQREVATERVR